jgi:hypothetical protein
MRPLTLFAAPHGWPLMLNLVLYVLILAVLGWFIANWLWDRRHRR